MGRSANPWSGVAWLYVDGSNLLHRLARDQGRPGALPPVALTGRLRAAVPRQVGLVVFLDGPPDPGAPARTRTAGLEVRHAGRGDADSAILRELRAADESGRILVVTDDRALAHVVREAGARSAGAAWLIDRLERPGLRQLSGATPDVAGSGEPEDEQRRTWRPGRGATVKRGNPRRAPRARR